MKFEKVLESKGIRTDLWIGLMIQLKCAVSYRTYPGGPLGALEFLDSTLVTAGWRPIKCKIAYWNQNVITENQLGDHP